MSRSTGGERTSGGEPEGGLIGGPRLEPGTTLRVIEVDPHRDSRWEHFAAHHPDGLVYQHPAWLRLLETQYGRPVTALACEDARGALWGVLPLCMVRGLPFGLGGPRVRPRFSSLPRTPVGGPLASNANAAGLLASAAVERARAAGVGLELKPWALAEPAPVDGLSEVEWGTTYTLDLPSDPDALRFGNGRSHAAIKRAVAKSRNEGVVVREADGEGDLRAWYRLYLATMRRHAAPPRPYRFFTTMWEVLHPNGLMRMLIAERAAGRSATPLAGSIFFSFGRTVVYAFNGSEPGTLGARPNDALHWRAIHDAVAEGYDRYDLGEVHDHQVGLARYKRKWGAPPRLLHRYYFPPLDGSPRSPDRRRSGRSLARTAWNRVPLALTELAGAALYHYV